ncbi:hypothetical protein KSP40_PGU022072 [Platanthera guangdongensis]|uniref:Glycerol-3-phosphate dehydrogenase NAD-dependent C-terminal domain-containing protein n=1 Tax=Platanthera guangdongensis TaxID=2320717 RepID=A0ABR2M2T0_9ASPA
MLPGGEKLTDAINRTNVSRNGLRASIICGFSNLSAAIMRIGLREMRALSKLLFSSVKDNTFFESCGVADVITTCRKEAMILLMLHFYHIIAT